MRCHPLRFTSALIGAVAVVTASMLAGCGSAAPSTQAGTAPAGAAAQLAGKDAAGVVGWLKQQQVPVTVTKAYDENTDPNHRLGRPGGYTSKAAFQDARVPADEFVTDVDDSDRGGSVEVFRSRSAAVDRARYVQTILKAFGHGSEYDYVVNGALVRVTGTVTPSQAASYQQALGVKPQPAA
jgi:hypothetical protein